jgi:hypothetical protein
MIRDTTLLECLFINVEPLMNEAPIICLVRWLSPTHEKEPPRQTGGKDYAEDDPAVGKTTIFQCDFHCRSAVVTNRHRKRNCAHQSSCAES